MPTSPTDPNTRGRILDAAERLFTERGFRGTSLRALTAEASVNLAAVHYHFGSKEELLRAVLVRRAEPVNAERLKRLSALEASAEDLTVERVLDALLRPALDALQLNATVVEGVAHLLYSEPEEIVKPLLEELFGEVSLRFDLALARACPHLAATERASRFVFLIGAMMLVLSGRHAWGPEGRRLAVPPSVEELIDELVVSMAAAFSAKPAHSRRGSEDAA